MFDAQSQQYLLAPTGKKGESENLKKKIKKCKIRRGGPLSLFLSDFNLIGV